MRKCNICGKEKSLEEFNNRKEGKEGKSYVCKECNRIRCRRWYQQKGGKKIKQEYYWWVLGSTTKEELEAAKRLRENSENPP